MAMARVRCVSSPYQVDVAPGVDQRGRARRPR